MREIRGRGGGAEGGEQGGGGGAFETDFGGTGGDILQLNLVGDDVAAEMRGDLFAQLGLGFDEEMVREAEQKEVGLYSALRGEEEGVAAVAGDQLLYFIAGEVVEKARAVAAAGHDAAAGGKVDAGGAAAQRVVTLAHPFSLEDAAEVNRNQDDDEAGDHGAGHEAGAARVMRPDGDERHDEHVRDQQQLDAQQSVVADGMTGSAEDVVEAGEEQAKDGEDDHRAIAVGGGLAQRFALLRRERSAGRRHGEPGVEEAADQGGNRGYVQPVHEDVQRVGHTVSIQSAYDS